MNGRSPWRIVSRWLDPARNELHLFESENLWFDPAPFITWKRIRVSIDSKRYSMDVSSADGSIVCTLANPAAPKHGPHNEVDVSCSTPAGEATSFNAVVNVTGP